MPTGSCCCPGGSARTRTSRIAGAPTAPPASSCATSGRGSRRRRTVGDEARRFLGFWEIDRIERRTVDGTELPTGQFAAGYLVYMPSGYMAVHLMRSDRRPYEGPRPTVLEAHAAMGSYASYFGPFSVDAGEGVVVHHRAGHLDPGSIGVDAPRAFEFRDGQLILRPPVATIDGQEVQTSVFWNR